MSSASIQKFCGVCSALKCCFEEFVREKVVFPSYSSDIHKINTQKSFAFLYTNNEKVEKEIKETIPFTIAKDKNKILRNIST